MVERVMFGKSRILAPLRNKLVLLRLHILTMKYSMFLYSTADPPGQAFISKDTEMVVKGQAITLTCSVDEPGRPEATKYIWQRGGHVVNYVNSFNWTIDPVTLETEANISCVAVNEVGQGSPDFINIQVIGKHLAKIVLELRQYKNDSIAYRNLFVLKLARFFTRLYSARE